MLLTTLSGCKKAEVGGGDGPWKVSIEGYGPIKTGMTPAEAQTAGSRPLTSINPGSEECDFVQVQGDTTRGVQFMVVAGQIARVDIDDSAISTNHGIRIGDSEAKVQEAYPGRVTVTPHKYVDGHYLTIAPETPADSTFRVIFETDGTRVTTYRSGRMP
ncbi:MAG: hypothetical protein ABI836_02255, partial [Gemmatimonadota bacterium]